MSAVGLPPICIYCRRLVEENEELFACTAYPEGIPEAIVMNQTDHRKPFEGDHGQQFEVKPGSEAKAEDLFSLLTFAPDQ